MWKRRLPISLGPYEQRDEPPPNLAFLQFAGRQRHKTMELVSRTAFGSKLREFGARQVGITLAGLALLLVWGLWWSSSLRVDRLRAAQRTWVPSQSKLGVDFLNNYHAARHWLAGGNPYTEPIGDPL